MTEKLRVVPCPIAPGCWAVFDDDEAELGEFGDYGYVAAGFSDEAKARAWLEDYRLEKQCREWEHHVRSEDPMEEIPF
jgi:hypothetical protein